MPDALDAIPPAELERLLALLEGSGRQALLEELKLAGFDLRARQDWANALSRLRRERDAPPPDPLAPQPSVEPLVICAEAGLCNKLRCLLSYYEVAQDEGRHLFVVWPMGDYCPSSFYDLFEPIEGVTVLCDDQVSVGLGEALRRMETIPAAVPGTFGQHPATEGTRREIDMWRHLRPHAEERSASARRASTRCISDVPTSQTCSGPIRPMATLSVLHAARALTCTLRKG